MPPLGNDVVDLEAPDNRGKCGDRRFLDRVFTAQERGLIDAADRPDTLLWAIWAAKEAAYKAVSRDDPTVCSISRHYPVLLDCEKVSATQCGAKDPLCSFTPDDSHAVGLDFLSEAGEARLLTGRILTPWGGVALQITVTDSYVHALAAAHPEVFFHIVKQVDRSEEGKGREDPSVFVRARLLRAIADRLHLRAEEIEIRKDPKGPGVPRVFRRGLPLADEISLSHDGRFTAFAWNPSV